MSRDLYVDGASPSPAPDGSSWANAYPDLQQALTAATTGDRLLIADGTYTPTATTDRTISFALKEGVSLLGGYAGYGAANPDARDLTLYPTILSGDIGTPGTNTDNSYHVITASNITSATTLDGLTITAGNANGDSALGQTQGGGMHSSSSSLTLTDCTFVANSASSGGGGVYNASSSLSLTNCTFIGNSADGGGGMHSIYASATLTNCIFTRNSAGKAGGGMFNYASSPTLTNSDFRQNSAEEGGGMWNYLSSPILANSSFRGNSATGSGPGLGAGMFNINASSPLLINALFSGNSATDEGGAIFNGDHSSPTLTNCTLVGNSPGRVGGVISNYDHSGPILTNSIIWDSGASPIRNADTSSVPVITYSDVQGGHTGTGNLNAAPLFIRNPSVGADGEWGTADDDYGDLRLQPTSPCIDAGNNAAPGLAGITTDLAGNPRIADASVDMGAYELDLAPTLTSVLINDGAAQRSMVKTVSVLFSEPVSLTPDALSLHLSTGQFIPGTTITLTNPSGDQKTYLLTFSGPGAAGGSLPDGIYDLLISAPAIQDLTGHSLTANYTQRFHRLFGDVDGNKVVNALDYAKLKATYGRSSADPLFNSAFDYEANNVINALDLAQFRKRYGLSLSY